MDSYREGLECAGTREGGQAAGRAGRVREDGLQEEKW